MTQHHKDDILPKRNFGKPLNGMNTIKAISNVAGGYVAPDYLTIHHSAVGQSTGTLWLIGVVIALTSRSLQKMVTRADGLRQESPLVSFDSV